MEEATVPSETGYAGAFLGGLLGAAVGAAACAAISLGFHFVLGGLTVLIGLATAGGVWLLGGRRGGPAARYIAYACALFGYLAAIQVVKGYLHANWVEAHEGVRPGLVDPRVWKYVWGNPDRHFGVLDLLGAALALWGASIVPSAAPRRPAGPAA